MAEGEKPKRTPHDALIEALEHVEDMDGVLIIFEKKGGDGCGSVDSDLTISECLYLMSLFQFWLMSHALRDE